MGKFKKFVENAKVSDFENFANHAIVNNYWLEKSFKIAVCILEALKEQKLTQSSFAEKLGVSPQQVNKIVKGKENLTLETICRIETCLNIKLLNIGKPNNFPSAGKYTENIVMEFNDPPATKRNKK